MKAEKEITNLIFDVSKKNRVVVNQVINLSDIVGCLKEKLNPKELKQSQAVLEGLDEKGYIELFHCGGTWLRPLEHGCDYMYNN